MTITLEKHEKLAKKLGAILNITVPTETVEKTDSPEKIQSLLIRNAEDYLKGLQKSVQPVQPVQQSILTNLLNSENFPLAISAVLSAVAIALLTVYIAVPGSFLFFISVGATALWGGFLASVPYSSHRISHFFEQIFDEVGIWKNNRQSVLVWAALTSALLLGIGSIPGINLFLGVAAFASVMLSSAAILGAALVRLFQQYSVDASQNKGSEHTSLESESLIPNRHYSDPSHMQPSQLVVPNPDSPNRQVSTDEPFMISSPASTL